MTRIEYLETRIDALETRRDDVSCLAREYVIECVTRDLGKIKLLESRGEKHFLNMAQL